MSDGDVERERTYRSGSVLARKYAVFVGAAICLALGLNSAIATIFAFSDQRALVVRVQQEQAQAAAQRIGAFVDDIMRSLDWASQDGVSANPEEDRRLDGLRLMRRIPAILELHQVDTDGRELLALSRLGRDRSGSGTDWSHDSGFQVALAQGNFLGEVQFRRGSEPYMVLARRTATRPHRVALATVNLTFIRDLISRLKVGQSGRAYIVERSGRLIAHPDLRFVLKNTNLDAMLRAHEQAGSPNGGLSTIDIEGRSVLSVMTAVPDLDWSVVIDLPQSEAFAPIYASFLRSLGILVAALLAAVLASVMLSRKLVAPIRALGDGAAQIGRGRLDERISINTGDELQELGEQFNLMAQRLQDSRSVLEEKVSERTAALAHALDLASAGQRAAEEATKAKSRFLAVVGHDIRTPLSGVLGVLEVLDRRRLGRRDRRLVEMAATSGEALIDLANATLDLSRLEAGTETLDLRDFDLAPLLEATAGLMRPLAERKGLELTLQAAGEERRRLHGDPGKIQRILVNLLRNAIDFTDEGGIEFGVDVRLGQSPERLNLTFVVRDTGIGIDPAMQGRIFEDFVQVDPETGRRSGGVGLGLAICSKLAELMGGTISVVSTLGEGSTFSVTLPVMAAKTAARPDDPVTKGQSQTVLVVDDEPVTREVARVMVGKAGHKVIAVASGEEALSALRDHAVDLVLLDMHMAGIDGVETALAIRALPGIDQPLLVVLTADVAPETMRRLRAAGLTSVLSKPITSAALLQVIGRGSGRGQQGASIDLATDQPVDAAFFRAQRQVIGADRTAHLVSLFATVSGDLLKGMHRAVAASGRAELERLAHQFGSSAAALGLGRVFGQANALEREARGAEPAALVALVQSLEKERHDALAALRALTPEAAPEKLRQACRSATMPSL